MKTSARDIQLFVGGAFALTGFRALIWLPYDFTISADSPRIIGSIVAGLTLPIGIGMLMNHARATQLAQIYLWFVVISECIAIPTFYYFLPAKIGRLLWTTFPDTLVSLVLLGIILWSHGRRFAHGPSPENPPG
jgi:hypothetical protein